MTLDEALQVVAESSFYEDNLTYVSGQRPFKATISVHLLSTFQKGNYHAR